MIENNIRVERARLKLSQAELARMVNVTRQTIHSIENNKFVPSVEMALKIAKVFQRKVEDIFHLQ